MFFQYLFKCTTQRPLVYLYIIPFLYLFRDTYIDENTLFVYMILTVTVFSMCMLHWFHILHSSFDWLCVRTAFEKTATDEITCLRMLDFKFTSFCGSGRYRSMRRWIGCNHTLQHLTAGMGYIWVCSGCCDIMYKIVNRLSHYLAQE